MKKFIVSSMLILSTTAFVLNFCACGTKSPEVEATQEMEQMPETTSEETSRGPGGVVYVSSDAQFNQLISQGNVVVDFYADWCNPCKQLSPVIDQLAQENPTITFVKVNVDKFDALKSKYKIKGIPALLFFKNGQQVDKSSGSQGKSTLQAKLNSLFAH